MTTTRRQFLKALTLLPMLPLVGSVGCSVNPQTKRVFVSGYRNQKNINATATFGLLGFDMNGQIAFDFPVEHEVHIAKYIQQFSINAQRTPLIVSSSRKPNAPLLIYDLKGNTLVKMSAPSNVSFEGHVIERLNQDGSLDLYASAQSDIDHKGAIIHYHLDANIFNENQGIHHSPTIVKAQNTFPMNGIGSHELIWLNNRDIAMAITGVATHPKSNQTILNLDTIESSVVIMDSNTGTIKRSFPVQTNGLSARHIAKLADGRILVGCQYRLKDKRPPAVGFIDQDGFQLSQEGKGLDSKLQWDMQSYTASVAAIPNSTSGLISNPRGHILSQWESASDLAYRFNDSPKYVKGISILDQNKIVITAGAGEVWHLDLHSDELIKINSKIRPNVWLGNHLT